MLIICANGFPILARHIHLLSSFEMPIDNHKYFFIDNKPVLGSAKTWRGLAASIILTPLLALALGLSLWNGFMIAALAMSGDLISSFIKRRLDIENSGRAFGLDQIPESALPLFYLYITGLLSFYYFLAGITLFLITEPAISYVLFKIGIRKHPY